MAAKEYHLDKFHIINSTESIVEDILRICKTMSEEEFFKGDGKWSVAENIDHLRLSFNKSWKGLFIPKIISRLIFKKPQSPSLPYEVLEEKYQQLLANGAKATKEYIPDFSKNKPTKEELLQRFTSAHTRYLNEVKYYWEEENMDRYQFPHPILGLITARELMYFNLFHCWHHFRTIRRRNHDALEL
jgi:DinB superfamily